MQRPERESQARIPGIGWTSGFFLLLFLYPLLSLVWRRSYPLFSLEVGLLAAGLAVVSVLLAWVLSQVRPWLAVAFTVLVLTLALTVQFDLVLAGLSACLLLGGLLAVVLKHNLYRLGLPVLGALVLGAWFDAQRDSRVPGPTVEQVAVGGPGPVVHVLLDGFPGLEGLEDVPGSDSSSKRAVALMQRFGFQVFPRAYTRYGTTVNSMFSAFNFYHGNAPGISLEEDSRKRHTIRENRHFAALDAAGYGLRIYQTEYLDYCDYIGPPPEHCWTYPQPNLRSIRAIASPKRRARILATVLLGQSVLVSDLFGVGKRITKLGVTYHDPLVWSLLTRDVLERANGRYFFAHVMLPHSPFVYQGDCALDYAGRVWATATETAHAGAHGAMLEQLDCTLSKIEALLIGLQQAQLMDTATILLHGDHGSFLTLSPPELRFMNRMRVEDYRAAFSTFFAVRFPNGRFSMDNRTLPLPFLMERFSAFVTDRDRLRGAGLEPVLIPRDEALSLEQFVYLKGQYPWYRMDIDMFER